MLIRPKDIEDAHKWFEEVVKTKFQSIVPNKQYEGYALDRNGHNVPVRVTLRPWVTSTGDGLLTGTIKPRDPSVTKMEGIE